MTKFELIQEYHQLKTQLKAAASNFGDGSWSTLYDKRRTVANKLLDEMSKMKQRENETLEEYLERRRRLRETAFS